MATLWNLLQRRGESEPPRLKECARQASERSLALDAGRDTTLARVVAILGDIGTALDQLAAAVAGRSFPILIVARGSDFEAVRADGCDETPRTSVWQE